jgi:hypothetical protein
MPHQILPDQLVDQEGLITWLRTLSILHTCQQQQHLQPVYYHAVVLCLGALAHYRLAYLTSESRSTLNIWLLTLACSCGRSPLRCKASLTAAAHITKPGRVSTS